MTGARGNLHGIELMALGTAWALLALGVVLPIECHTGARSHIIATLFAGDAMVCTMAGVAAILTAAGMIGSWVLLRRRPGFFSTPAEERL